RLIGGKSQVISNLGSARRIEDLYSQAGYSASPGPLPEPFVDTAALANRLRKIIQGRREYPQCLNQIALTRSIWPYQNVERLQLQRHPLRSVREDVLQLDRAEKPLSFHRGLQLRPATRVAFVGDGVDGVEDRLSVGLRPVVAVGAVGGPVGFSRQGAGCRVEPVVAALHFQDLLEHRGGGAAGDVFVEAEEAVGLFERFDDSRFAVERQEGLDVDDFGLNTHPGERFGGFERDLAAGA